MDSNTLRNELNEILLEIRKHNIKNNLPLSMYYWNYFLIKLLYLFVNLFFFHINPVQLLKDWEKKGFLALIFGLILMQTKAWPYAIYFIYYPIKLIGMQSSL